eukprot:gnl/MRDRNA2_/MRDRNA2_73414_c0_seq1.p1 gnl/MRDRNA2_/MRDRNA2_73414_c0~~gnl/MRDRNA2_/MRDRNA2_73414_c0_seq1.p1  ORF type:complete len:788 (-),score=123.31 gnl/MRDRNA2_/MRDRNA2_73414_c0_seq1:480-2756(-)
MEAEGFRRFTPFQDRPDVMASYTKVRIEADSEQCPILLSNGNLLEKGLLANGRHFAVWSDPFPKPSYLFALVAGNLGSIKDEFVTRSGRKVALEIFSEPRNVDYLHFAMQSIKKAMKWDEDRYGLEYDLDIFNLVAVNDFNYGAMENKGLNIFKVANLLADHRTTTDAIFETVQGVIGHEYFHNWSGNRVTCRDWFQLTLKEGLTVYRQQEFMSDMGSHAVKRIQFVTELMNHQFLEDSGPTAHPIQPDCYVAVDDLATNTIFKKGAEVIRMYETLLGRDGFRKGLDLYWARHDGRAVTCDDFRTAMSDVTGKDLRQFEKWYHTAGTPEVDARGTWNAVTKEYQLILSQKIPSITGQTNEGPLHIPVRVGLLDRYTGEELVSNTVLELTQKSQTFVFSSLDAEDSPIPSLLRDFSAPVKIRFPYTDEELSLLAAADTDLLNRWQAIQCLSTKVVLTALSSADIEAYQPPTFFIHAMKAILQDNKTKDLELLAYALTLPAESSFILIAPAPLDPVRLHRARHRVLEVLAHELRPLFKSRMDSLKAPEGSEFKIDAESIGRRRLRNVCLEYYTIEKDNAATMELFNYYQAAQGMTEKVFALKLLLGTPDAPQTVRCLQNFYEEARQCADAKVMHQWFALQASADVDDLLPRVEKLMEHPEFTLKNPDRMQSVVGLFINSWQFHQADGLGYKFLAERVAEVDKFNPVMSAQLVRAFAPWVKRLDIARQKLIKAQLVRLQDQVRSKNVLELVNMLSGCTLSQ